MQSVLFPLQNKPGAQPEKFLKHCIAILTFLQKRSKNKDEILYSNRFKEKS